MVNVYSQVFLTKSVKVLVVEAANDWEQSEVVCPNVINPGEYFLCKIDVPYGNGLTATVTLGDNIYSVANITTGSLDVPGERCL